MTRIITSKIILMNDVTIQIMLTIQEKIKILIY